MMCVDLVVVGAVAACAVAVAVAVAAVVVCVVGVHSRWCTHTSSRQCDTPFENSSAAQLTRSTCSGGDRDRDKDRDGGSDSGEDSGCGEVGDCDVWGPEG